MQINTVQKWPSLTQYLTHLLYKKNVFIFSLLVADYVKMQLKILIINIILVLLLNFTLARYETKQITQIDQLRHDFLLLEPELWELTDLVKESNQPELELLKRFKLFDDILHQVN